VVATIPIKFWQSEEYPTVAIGQCPLSLAWAMTIHKIQGATLSMAEIDVGGGIFECGQTYVALSRVKDLEGLYLSKFDPKKIKSSVRVRNFYRDIPEVEYEVEEETEVKEPVTKFGLLGFEQFAMGGDVDEDVDIPGVTERDVDLVVSQACCLRSDATNALKKYDNDIVDAIRSITM
jgi:NACalpha-BTF3-like transcription factor